MPCLTVEIRGEVVVEDFVTRDEFIRRFLAAGRSMASIEEVLTWYPSVTRDGKKLYRIGWQP